MKNETVAAFLALEAAARPRRRSFRERAAARFWLILGRFIDKAGRAFNPGGRW